MVGIPLGVQVFAGSGVRGAECEVRGARYGVQGRCEEDFINHYYPISNPQYQLFSGNQLNKSVEDLYITI